ASDRNFLERYASGCGDRFGDNSGVRGFSAFSAEGNGSEIGAIRFDHEFIKRQLRGDRAHFLAVLKCDDAGKRNEMTKADKLFGLIHCSPETVKNPARLPGVRPQQLEGVIPRITLVNDHI